MPLEGEYEPSPWEPVAEQVEQYESTDGVEGNDWEGANCIILHTLGRRSGKVRKTPLIRVERDGSYVVVASMGGAPQHPVWYLNLRDHPTVTLRDRAEVRDYRARTVTGDEKPDWWAVATAAWPAYDEYQAATEREIPLVVLDPI